MRPRFLRSLSSTPTRIAESGVKVTKVEEMAEVEQETLDAPGGGAELLQQGIEATHRTPRPAEPAPAEAMGVGTLSGAAAASSLVRSGSREMPIQCTVEESSDGAEHSTSTPWVVPTIT